MKIVLAILPTLFGLGFGAGCLPLNECAGSVWYGSSASTTYDSSSGLIYNDDI